MECKYTAVAPVFTGGEILLLRSRHRDIWNAFVFHSQTVIEIHRSTGCDSKSIRRYLHGYTVPEKKDHAPGPIHLVIDTIFFDRRKDRTSWGLTLFRDYDRKENL